MARGGKIETIRRFFERWGGLLSILTTILATVVGISYVATMRLAALESLSTKLGSLEEADKEFRAHIEGQKTSLLELKGDTAQLRASPDVASLTKEAAELGQALDRVQVDVGEIREGLAALGEAARNLAGIREDAARLDSRLTADARELRTKIDDLVGRLSKLEAKANLASFIRSGRLLGGAIKTKEGTKIFTKDQLEGLQREAEETIDSGGGTYRTRLRAYDPNDGKCVEIGDGCMEVSSYEPTSGELRFAIHVWNAATADDLAVKASGNENVLLLANLLSNCHRPNQVLAGQETSSLVEGAR